MDLKTNAERAAAHAESLAAFRGFSLLKTRDVLTELLAQIGRTTPFREYTAHDISHIDALLESLDWIIPPSTVAAMSTADWLMTVLGCYFHDLGMLVTEEEFANRSRSAFPTFLQRYRLTLSSVGASTAFDGADEEAFIYQEYVREHHAKRAQQWVSGKTDSTLGISNTAARLVDEVLRHLDKEFREDLGTVCLSHHQDNLNDLTIYDVRKPYGSTQAETVNLQYCALLLRTVDLLHITRDRVPGVRYELIAPRNPVSQREWAKQQAVRRVRAQPKRDAEGKVLEAEQPDTVEVHATFTDPEAFFALDSYLTYASHQLRRSHEWSVLAQRQESVPHTFPWAHIDSSYVKAEGFLRQQFRFVLDQTSILDLLTGHTLYNDSTVVVRELLQNAIDAVRLHRLITGQLGTPDSDITLTWDEPKRELTVVDSGTGMTQSQIENNFLKVGSSRYQDSDFKKQYPSFSAISRFGIGVLSTFMIADYVDVYTRATEEDTVRHLKLRDVHGRYLIRELEPTDPAVPTALGEHGTIVRLRVRSDVEAGNPLEAARHWVVSPDCRIAYKSPPDAPTERRVGWDDVPSALVGVIRRYGGEAKQGLEAPYEDREIRVLSLTRGDTELAFAVRWNSYFQSWEFADGSNLRSIRNQRGEEQTIADDLATCVEGIPVESGPPGFLRGRDPDERRLGPAPLGIANATGTGAPRTNVARSGLEQSEARDRMLHEVYECLCGHIHSEYQRLVDTTSLSPTRAVEELRINAGLFGMSTPESWAIAWRSLAGLPLFIVEDDTGRRSISMAELDRILPYFTSESALLRSLEGLLRNAPKALSLFELAQRLDIEVTLPEGKRLAVQAFKTEVDDMRDRRHEPTSIVASPEDGRVTTAWSRRADTRRWFRRSDLSLADSPVNRLFRTALFQRSRGSYDICIPWSDDVRTEMPKGVVGAVAVGSIYMSSQLGLREYFEDYANALSLDSPAAKREANAAEGLVVFEVIATAARERKLWAAEDVQGLERSLSRYLATELGEGRYLPAGLVERLVAVLGGGVILDPSRWERRDVRN